MKEQLKDVTTKADNSVNNPYYTDQFIKKNELRKNSSSKN